MNIQNQYKDDSGVWTNYDFHAGKQTLEYSMNIILEASNSPVFISGRRIIEVPEDSDYNVKYGCFNGCNPPSQFTYWEEDKFTHDDYTNDNSKVEFDTKDRAELYCYRRAAFYGVCNTFQIKEIKTLKALLKVHYLKQVDKNRSNENLLVLGKDLQEDDLILGGFGMRHYSRMNEFFMANDVNGNPEPCRVGKNYGVQGWFDDQTYLIQRVKLEKVWEWQTEDAE
jgi:hypothetical protein